MFSPIEDILADLRAGTMIILTDDENRENEGDLVLPAQFATPEAITFMLSVARGYLCLSMTEADCGRLELHPQAAVNTTIRGTAFTVSVDGHPRHGFTTGVSAKERAKCIQMMIDTRYGTADFTRPGHINPLRSRDGGVLVRTGQTEGSLDLCRLAGLYPAACIIEIMRDDGEMARVPDLAYIGRKHNLKMCSVAQVIQHRLARESLVRRLEPREGRPLRTRYGTFNALLYQSLVDPLPHLVLTMGDVGKPIAPAEVGAGALLKPLPLGGVGVGAFQPLPRAEVGVGDHTHDVQTSSLRHSTTSSLPTLVRMHRRHLLGDVFGDLDASPDGPTDDLLHASMKAIADEGRGAIVYLRTQGWADGLEGELQAIRGKSASTGDDDPHLTRADGAAGRGEGAIQSQLRQIGVGGQILRDLGLTRLRLLTNHPKALPGLEAFGIEIVETVPIEVHARSD